MSRKPPPSPRRPASRAVTTAERIIKILVIGIGLLAVAGAGVFAAALYAVRDQEGSRTGNAARLLVEEVVRPELIFQGRARVNILLIGEDISLNNKRQQLKEFSRSDTNILISLDRLTGTAHILSLPRDTKVDIPGHGVHKLNAAHRYGGPFLLIQTIRENLGLEVDHYLKTNFRGFVELVDLVGGIDLEVERDMDYDDSWQDFHVHLKKGFQHLTGEQAHGYVRWRKSKNGDYDPKGDLGRIERQQKVIKVLARKALSPQYLPKLRGMVTTARKYLETDLTDKQLLSLLLFLNKLDPATLDTATLPSDYTGFYMEINRTETELLLGRMFAHTFDPSRLHGGYGGAEEELPATRLRDPQPSRLRALEEEPPAVEPLAEEAPPETAPPAEPLEGDAPQPEWQAPPIPPERPRPERPRAERTAPAPPPAPQTEPEGGADGAAGIRNAPAPTPAPAPAPAEPLARPEPRQVTEF